MAENRLNDKRLGEILWSAKRAADAGMLAHRLYAQDVVALCEELRERRDEVLRRAAE